MIAGPTCEATGSGVALRAACRAVAVATGGTTGGTQQGEAGLHGAVVPPLEPLSTRILSPRFLSKTERITISWIHPPEQLRPG